MSNNDVIYDPSKRHDFAMLVEVIDSNPNGDPDAGNLPRIDPETNQGIVTDVAVKRKVRDYVSAYADILEDDNPQKHRLKIFIESGTALNTQIKRSFTDLGLTGKKKISATNEEARAWMCDNFFDIRMFGAVMSTGDYNAGQVKGPIQIGFGRSVDPIFQQEITITRCAVTKEEELIKQQQEDGGKSQEMGRKSIVPYGLYRIQGTYSPMLGFRRQDGNMKPTGVTEYDMELIWNAILNMWDFNTSAARGNINLRGLYIFSHTNPLGDDKRYKLMDRIRVQSNTQDAPRSINDYDITIDLDNLKSEIIFNELS